MSRQGLSRNRQKRDSRQTLLWFRTEGETQTTRALRLTTNRKPHSFSRGDWNSPRSRVVPQVPWVSSASSPYASPKAS